MGEKRRKKERESEERITNQQMSVVGWYVGKGSLAL